MCEQSIIGARASVMVYDDNQKKWVPSGSSSGLSKVQIYHHQQNNTFRVVGRKLQDHEVVINCSIVKGLKYNQATSTFHQWRDSKYVYGLNFSSPQDAEAFSRAMLHALDVLSGRYPQQTTPISNNSAYEEDMGYRTMTREDAAIIQQQQIISSVPQDTPSTPNSHSSANIQQTSQTPPQGHHRTSSAPPAPQPPPISPGLIPINAAHMQQQQQQQQTPQFHQTTPIEKHFNQQPIYLPQGSLGSNQNTIPYSQSNITTNISHNVVEQQQQQQQQQQQPQHHQQSHAGGPIYISANQIQPSINNNSVYAAAAQQQQQQQPPTLPINVVSNSYGAAPPLAPPMPPNLCGINLVTGGPPQPPAPPMLVPPQPPPLLLSSSSSSSSSSTTIVRNATAPPPPPLPPMGMLTNKSDGGMDMSSLAAQLQQAKLKRNNKSSPSNPPSFENSGSSVSSGGSGGSGGGYGTIGRPKMASMMDEMAKTLARRRAQADKNIEPDALEDTNGRRIAEKSNTLPHKLSSTSNSSNSSNATNAAAIVNNTNTSGESPRLLRKRFGSISDDTIFKQMDAEDVVLTNKQELMNFKAEIIREIQHEISKAKQDIIEALKIELNRS